MRAVFPKNVHWWICSWVSDPDFQSSMFRRIFICCILLGIVIGFSLFRGATDKVTAPVAVDSPTSPELTARDFTSAPSSSSDSLSASLKPATFVTLQDISSLSDSAQFEEAYQHLSSELVQELVRLRATRDRDRVISRITPVAQKFYYLKKARKSFDEAPVFHLPESFRSEIQNLEELWSSNDILAQAADSVFAHMEILDREHIPYQLREKLQNQ